jgi:predicted metal-binding membrane protein
MGFYDRQETARVRNPVLLMSAATWILLFAAPQSLRVFAHCIVLSSGGMPKLASLRMLLAMNPPSSLAVGWALMLVAMMSPALIPPLCHIRLRSFTRRRARSIALFATGYGVIWMAIGGVLLAIELVVKSIAPQSCMPVAGLAFVALVWQCSPIKQRCLNRCHAHRELAAFGVAADLDVLCFGITHGVWCAGSCWALMLFPMLLPEGHLIAMAAVTVLIFSERLEQPTTPSWRWRGFGKAIRIAIAQVRIRMLGQRLGSASFSSVA